MYAWCACQLYMIDISNQVCKSMVLNEPVFPPCVGANSTNPFFVNNVMIAGGPAEQWSAFPNGVPNYGDFFIRRYTEPQPVRAVVVCVRVAWTIADVSPRKLFCGRVARAWK